MLRVVLLGTGNVATHLFRAFSESEDVIVAQVFGRSKSALNTFDKVPVTTSLSKLVKADAYIIAITDDAISDFSESLLFRDRLVCHTSGSVSMKELTSSNRKGVFYPLQTFTKGLEVAFSDIPICIEAENEEDLKLLRMLGQAISGTISEINSEERGKLHLAAVFVNNFVNYMYQVGHEILEENEISFELLKPLIFETARKISEITPAEAQTGPAKRTDRKTIENHLHLLEGSPHKELYQAITEVISSAYGTKL